MKIHLYLPESFKRFLDVVEEHRMRIGLFLTVLLLLLLSLQALLRSTPRAELLLDLGAITLLGSFFYQLRKRHSLKWKSERLLSTLRAPREINLTRELSEFYQFKSMYAVVFLCGIAALLLLPSVPSISRFRIFALTSGLITSANRDFFMALWQVHAAFVGFFLVLLTFVFQFVSVKWADLPPVFGPIIS
jgi:hypothetical protein